MEERDDVFCFMLIEIQNVSILFLDNGRSNSIIIVFILTKRNIMMISYLN